MKPLIASLLISLSGICPEGGVALHGWAVGERPAGVEAGTVVGTSSRDPPDWCDCSVSIEEAIFLQQYDFN
jgi:hypothetical protein